MLFSYNQDSWVVLDWVLSINLCQRNQKLLIPVNLVFKEISLDQAFVISENMGMTKRICPSPWEMSVNSSLNQHRSFLTSPLHPWLLPCHPSSQLPSFCLSLREKLIHSLSQPCSRPGQWVPAKNCVVKEPRAGWPGPNLSWIWGRVGEWQSTHNSIEERTLDLEREHATWIPTFLSHANLGKWQFS